MILLIFLFIIITFFIKFFSCNNIEPFSVDNNLVPNPSKISEVMGPPFGPLPPINGTITQDGTSFKHVLDPYKINSYTNNFIYTPICKVERIEYKYDTLQNMKSLNKCKLYTLGVTCKTDMEYPIKVTVWIIGLNKGLKHVIDKTYQDFRGKVVILKKGQHRITFTYQPKHILTVYLAIKLDLNGRYYNTTPINESLGKNVSTDRGGKPITVKWSNLVLAIGSKDNPDATYNSPIYKVGNNSQESGDYEICSKAMIDRFAVRTDNKISSHKISTNIRYPIPDSFSTKYHLCLKHFNTYLPYQYIPKRCIDNTYNDDTCNSHIHFTQVSINFNLAFKTQQKLAHYNSIYYNIIKHFLRMDKMLYDDSHDFHSNLFLFFKYQHNTGKLLGPRTNNTHKFNYDITDITLAVEDKFPCCVFGSLTGDKNPFSNISKDNKVVKVVSNKLFTKTYTTTMFQTDTTDTATASATSQVKLILNLYHNVNSFSSEFNDYIESSIRNFLELINKTKYTRLFLRTSYKYNYKINNINLTIDSELKKIPVTTNHCHNSLYPQNRQCNQVTTEIDAGINVPESCSCTRCNTDIFKDEFYTYSNVAGVGSNKILLTGVGTCDDCSKNLNINDKTCNIYNDTVEQKCLMHNNELDCNGACTWNKAYSNCSSKEKKIINFDQSDIKKYLNICHYNERNDLYGQELFKGETKRNFNPNIIKKNACNIYYNTDGMLSKTMIDTETIKHFHERITHSVIFPLKLNQAPDIDDTLLPNGNSTRIGFTFINGQLITIIYKPLVWFIPVKIFIDKSTRTYFIKNMDYRSNAWNKILNPKYITEFEKIGSGAEYSKASWINYSDVLPSEKYFGYKDLNSILTDIPGESLWDVYESELVWKHT